jgi:tetratricopeptide (TPR) repeat protein
MDDVFRDALQQHLAGQWAEAERLYGEILAAIPDHFEARHNLAYLHQQQRRHEQAAALFEQAIAIRATPFALANHALSLTALRRLDEAAEACRRAVALDPTLFAAHNNLSWAMALLGRSEDAIESAERASALDPAAAAPHANKAMALAQLNRLGEALAAYEEAARRDPFNPSIERDHALVLLRAGELRRGWQKYQQRFDAEPSVRDLFREFTGAVWTGTEPLQDRSVLVISEQGHGDAIQFGRYLPMLAERGARGTFLVQPPLVSLFQSMPRLHAVSGELAFDTRFDFRARLLSLPRLFDTTMATIPGRVPYLAADPALAEAWRARLPARRRLRVGVAWSGSAQHANDRQRSMPPQALAPLMDLHGVSFVSLQKDKRPGDDEFLRAHPQIADVTADLHSYADTAAVIDNLDVVVSVDTSIVHLAGALAKPVFVVLPFSCDWRWFHARDDSPWYPTVRLYRQPRPTEWASVVANVRETLAGMAAKRPSPP